MYYNYIRENKISKKYIGVKSLKRTWRNQKIMENLNLFELFGIKDNTKVETSKDKKKGKNKKSKTSTMVQMDLFSLNVVVPEKKEETRKTLVDNFEGAVNKCASLFTSSFLPSDKETLDYKITKRFLVEDASLKEKFNMNLKAVKMLKSIELQELLASREEQNTLVQYIGWGGLAKVFDEKDDRWKKEREQLQKVLTEKEYQDARRSTLSAYYTPIDIVRFMWAVVDRLGFDGGKILDPSMGVGMFEGLMTDAVKENSRIDGIEIDGLSARIAKQLYQSMKIENCGFEQAKLKDNSYDLVISNIPFGDFSVYDENDKDLNDKKLFIHDYFFMKALKKVRAGGIIAFITHHGTMDKENDLVRQQLLKNTELLGAVRLPNMAFKRFANTEVATDVIFLKKVERHPVMNSSWRNVSKVEFSHGTYNVNKYFTDYPMMCIGKLTEVSTQYGYTVECVADKSIDLAKELGRRVKYFPMGAYVPRENDYYMYEDDEMLSADSFPEVKEEGYALVSDIIYQRQGEKLLPCDFKGKRYNVVRSLINLKQHVKMMIEEQLHNCSDERLAELQKELGRMYDEFTFSYGNINSKDNNRFFSEDPDYYLLCSIEDKNKDGFFIKGDFFTKRTISTNNVVEKAENVNDALMVSLNIKGTMDLDYIAGLVSKTADEVKSELLMNRAVFLDPVSLNEGTEEFILSSRYLSGNVREKLKIAKEHVDVNPMLQLNVEELEKVVPEFVYDVFFQLGSTWIPSSVVHSFIMDLLRINDPEKLTVSYNNYLSFWKVKNNSYIDTSLMSVQYGTSRKTAIQIINDTLNLKDIEVYDMVVVDGTEKRILNHKETAFAREKQDFIKQEFNNWIERNEDTKKMLLDLYNSIFNSISNWNMNGSFLQLPGKNPAIELRPHQKDGIARILFGENNVLLAHTVGTGKTWTMCAAAMEMARLSIKKKVLFVVPNSLVKSGQFASEFLRLYPSARLLVATEKDFSRKNRRRFINKIMTNTYDAIIMGHSSFKMIPVSPENSKQFYDQQIAEIENALSELDLKNDRTTVKRLEKRKQSLETKCKSKMNAVRDDGLPFFETLGIDAVFVDEAHRFKNLGVYSANLGSVSGVPSQMSEKALDMFMKTQLMISKFGKSVVFATGTPISNSMAELYIMEKYLHFDKLNGLGFGTFDSWASTFGMVVSALEVTPTGQGFRQHKRFAKFCNIPELMKVFREVADIVTSNMVDIQRPKLKTGKPIVEQIEPTEEMKAFIDNLVDRAEKIYKGQVKVDVDNMLCVTNDGRKLAVDPRLVGLPDYSSEDTPKLNVLCNNVYKEWNDGRMDRLTQLVFCDLGTPTGKSFNFYEEIRNRLVEMGVPKAEIKLIHEGSTDEKRAKILEDVRNGVVRVLIGSTDKMGEGMNVQQRMVAIHEVDCPWRPSDVEQREGRLVRQGNNCKNVAIYRYVVKGSFDAYSWQTIERKATYIEQIMEGKTDIRSVEDISEKTLSYQETKAIAAANPIVLRKFEVDTEIQKLQMLKKAFSEQRMRISYSIDDKRQAVSSAVAFVEAASEDLKACNEAGEAFEIKIGDKVYVERTEAAEALDAEKLKHASVGEEEMAIIGSYKGFNIVYKKTRGIFSDGWKRSLNLMGQRTYSCEMSESALGNITRIENLLKGLEDKIAEKISYIERTKNEIQNLEGQTKLSFKDEERLHELLQEQREINKELGLEEGIIGTGASEDDSDESNEETA